MSLYCASFIAHNIPFTAAWQDEYLVSLSIAHANHAPGVRAGNEGPEVPGGDSRAPGDSRLGLLYAWLEAWYRGDTTPALPLAPAGSPFQRDVWEALQRVPRGSTISYRNLALEAGHPKAIRAVANACGANPIIILIPCHRVVRSDGSLGGFSAGVTYKEHFLAREGRSGPGGRPA